MGWTLRQLYFFGFLHLRVALAASRLPPQAHLCATFLHLPNLTPSSTRPRTSHLSIIITQLQHIQTPNPYLRPLRIMSEESPATPAVAADAGDSRAAAAESKPESTTVEPAQKQDDGKPSETEEKGKSTGLLHQWSEGNCRVANLFLYRNCGEASGHRSSNDRC